MTGRVDIYALGATLYEFLSGGRAYPQTDVAAPLSAKSGGLCEPLSDLLPKPLDAVVVREMSTKAPDRYESAAAMEKDLDKALRGPGVVSGYCIPENPVKRFGA